MLIDGRAQIILRVWEGLMLLTLAKLNIAKSKRARNYSSYTLELFSAECPPL